MAFTRSKLVGEGGMMQRSWAPLAEHLEDPGGYPCNVAGWFHYRWRRLW